MRSKQSPQKTILAVDDNLDILDFLRDLLEMEGYTVITTSRGDDLEKLEEGNRPHLILLDVFLSGKDGREIARHLKSQEKTRLVPIIMFSARPSAEATARAAGADDFLTKPFNLEELIAKVQAFIL